MSELQQQQQQGSQESQAPHHGPGAPMPIGQLEVRLHILHFLVLLGLADIR